MEICKAPTLPLKALNNHNITHNEHRDGFFFFFFFISNLTKMLT